MNFIRNTLLETYCDSLNFQQLKEQFLLRTIARHSLELCSYLLCLMRNFVLLVSFQLISINLTSLSG